MQRRVANRTGSVRKIQTSPRRPSDPDERKSRRRRTCDRIPSENRNFSVFEIILTLRRRFDTL